jgi:hypothetical protein
VKQPSRLAKQLIGELSDPFPHDPTFILCVLSDKVDFNTLVKVEAINS